MRAGVLIRVNVELDEREIALLATLFPGVEPDLAIKLALKRIFEGELIAGEMKLVGSLLEKVVDRLDITPQLISHLITERFEQLADAVASEPVHERVLEGSVS